ncbi:hypothetical protein [Streptomyces sp. CB03911]|uniref:hypothetical protein n=1 Tax=Streptomyces sp. CB03911 TaxID=1804758 RepID=UPI000939886A|nr:hypothetical protein [Streptomyces sp. CB03911]OKI22196.1 hypothetical protein A6A07_34540 [Streptomyces sp. CB03911]
MHTVATLSSPDVPTLVPYLDDYARQEYRAGRAGTTGTDQLATQGELWLLAVARPIRDAVTYEWVVYAITSEEDIPGWPSHQDDYTGGLREARDFAQPWVDAGVMVALRHYANLGFSATITDVALA